MIKFCDMLKLNKQLDECKQQRTALSDENTELKVRVETLDNDYASALGIIRDLNSKVTLLTKGPDAPPVERLRVASQGIQHQLYAEKLGQRYTDLAIGGHMYWSDLHWLVPQKPDVDRYCKYLKDNWLPTVKPYTVIEWVTLAGDVVKIAQIDCDDFADWFQGKNAEHGLWAGIAWGLFWGMVRGTLMTGPHAFNFVPTWEEPYNEQTTVGLTLWNLEPQVLGTWTVELPFGTARVGQVTSITPKPVEAGLFKIENLWLGKV